MSGHRYLYAPEIPLSTKIPLLYLCRLFPPLLVSVGDVLNDLVESRKTPHLVCAVIFSP